MTDGFDARRVSIAAAAQVALQLLPTESREPADLEVMKAVAGRIVANAPGEDVDADTWRGLYEQLGALTAPIIEIYDVGDLLEVYVADLLSMAIHHLQGELRSDHLWEEVINHGDGIAFLLDDPTATDPFEQGLQDLQVQAESLANPSQADLDRLSRLAVEFGTEHRPVIEAANQRLISRLPKPRS